MSVNKPYKEFTVFIITSLLLSSSFILLLPQHTQSTSILSTVTDQGDGFYLSTDFSDISQDTIHNCTFLDQNIILDPQGSGQYTYDFSSWSIGSDDRAFTYNTPYFYPFFPPESHSLIEQEIDSDFAFDSIGEPDDITYPMQSADNPSPFQRVHHFRFKITQNPDSLTKIGLHWRGKAENDNKVTFYYWQPFNIGNLGLWQYVEEATSNNSFIDFCQNFTGDLFLDQNNFIDICVVVTPAFGQRCSLFTDYVSITCHGIGYATKGWVRSPLIRPEKNNRWEQLIWSDFELSQTKISYQLLYENETGELVYVENSHIPGNNHGFTTSPINLLNVPPNYNLSIQANLSTSNLSRSPSLLRWGLTWQKDNFTWQDSLNSSLRVDSSYLENIEIDTGMIQLQPSLNHWPMFGQNPANTRASGGLGPNASSHALQWYSGSIVGGQNRNPVVRNGFIYAASEDGSSLYSFDAFATTKLSKANPIQGSTVLSSLTIENSPLITDSYVIVATGTSSKDGGVRNKIYAFPQDLGNTPLWIFDYAQIDPDNPAICYASSPVYADGKIYITSWNGDDSIWNSMLNLINISTGNNKLLVLDEDGAFQWQYTLPAGSFASPAIGDDVIIVGCDNKNGDSLFALKPNGALKWKRNIGPIGYASPVIYEDTVYVVRKQTTLAPLTAYSELVAININNGNIRWNVSIGDGMVEPYQYAAYNTPTVAEDRVYVASPDGYLHAFDIDEEEIWNIRIYNKGILSTDYLLTSPAYANGIVYIGTPDGIMHAIDAEDNSSIWSQQTLDGSAVISSPIIVDGLIYFISEDGSINCRGNHKLPVGEQITGSCVSIPIQLPDIALYKWDSFTCDYIRQNSEVQFHILDEDGEDILLEDIENGQNISTTAVNNQEAIRLRVDFSSDTNGEASLLSWSVSYKEKDEDGDETIFYDNSFTKEGVPPNCSIDIRNENVGIWNDSAAYKLQYENDSGVFTTDWIPTNCTGVNGSTDRETIWANTSKLSITDNITWYLNIRFKIKNSNGNESISQWYQITQPEYPDREKPEFNISSFSPSNQWISTPTPTCTIRVQDRETDGNVSGLNVSSARYAITYDDDSGTHTTTFKASCTGSNGTKSAQTITADLSDAPNSENFTDVSAIFFTIKDLAGNSNSSPTFSLTIDTEKPYSEISNTATIPSVTNKSPVLIRATAEDNESGIKDVTLYYRLSGSTQWSTFGNDSKRPFQWNFTVGPNNGGEYELCTVAKDNASNEESFPTQADVKFLFDPNPPKKPSFVSLYLFTTDEVPSFSNVTFTDDYKLKSVSYRMDFEDEEKWTQINPTDLTVKSYTPKWNLTQAQWDDMHEDTIYNIYFKVADTLGNTYVTPSENDAMKIKKDLEIITDFDPNLSDFETWRWNNEYTIRIQGNTSMISSIQLYYQYSSDNESWSAWEQVGDNLTEEPFSWSFTLTNGSGYYAFRTTVITQQGITETSAEKIVHVITFPFVELIVLCILIIFFFIISIFVIRRNKPQTK